MKVEVNVRGKGTVEVNVKKDVKSEGKENPKR